jgi:hypothetical protein
MKNLKVVFVNRCKLNRKILHLQGPTEFRTRLGCLRKTLKDSRSDWKQQLCADAIEGAHIVKMKKAGFRA